MAKVTTRHSARAAVFALAAAMLAPLPAQAESVLRVGMTAGDIPDWTGQPDQGFEGFRFVGWTLHDSFINWDLSRSDVEAPLRPGLATKWSIDPNDPKRWVFELRKGVKFHDGCDWNAVKGTYDSSQSAGHAQWAFLGLGTAALAAGGYLYWQNMQEQRAHSTIGVAPRPDGASITWSGSW